MVSHHSMVLKDLSACMIHLFLLSSFLLVKMASSQTPLSLELNSENLPDNSLVVLTDIAEEETNILLCRTSRTDCCSPSETGSNMGIGNWYAPDGSVIPDLNTTAQSGVGFYQERRAQSIALYRRSNTTSPYRCEIPGDNSAYIGLYLQGNGSPVITNLTENVGGSRLICTSSGGPVSTITWSQNGQVIPEVLFSFAVFSLTTSIMDPVTGTYEITLNARNESYYDGIFTCMVANSAGNSSRSLTLQGVHLSFNDTTFNNNSLISSDSISESTPLLCITDLSRCCSRDYTVDNGVIGEWDYPNNSIVQSNGVGYGLFRRRGSRQVLLNRREGVIVDGGIFRCDVLNITRQRVLLYIGIYSDDGGSPQVTNLEFSFDSHTLTCTSVGGPASEVTWLRNGTLVPTSDSEFQFHQRIMDQESATYLNILTGSRLGIFLGEFTCVVHNVRGESNQSLSIIIELPMAPQNLTVSPSSSTSIQISWNRLPNQIISEYRLSYTYAGSCPGVQETIVQSIEDGDVTTYTLSPLEEDSLYFISLVAVNDIGDGEPANTSFTTPTDAPSGMPQSPTVMETMTTLSISWERVECLQRNSEITGYRLFIISFYGTRIRNVTRTSSRNQTLTEMNLIPNTEYTIEIGAVNSNGGIGPNLTFNVTTRPAQEVLLQLNGERFGNNSIFDPQDIGEGESALFCLTSNLNCCRGSSGRGARGDWFDSSGTDLPNLIDLPGGVGFYSNRGSSVVRLNRAGSVSSAFTGGLFQCKIPGVDDVLQELIIGLYPPNTGRLVITSLTYDSVSSSLICMSSGGPVTTVTWTHNGVLIGQDGVTFEESQRVVMTSAVYHNVLRLRRTNETENVGIYRCTVGNNRGNTTSMELNVQESVVSFPTGVLLGAPTSIRCSAGEGGQSERIEWLNGTGDVILTDANTQALDLVFNTTNLNVNNTVYTCRVSNRVSKPILLLVQGSGPPQMLWNSSTATNLTLSWQPPQQTRRSFFQYAVNCTPLAEGLPVPGTVTTAFGETTARLTNLEEGSSYECSVYAQIDGYLSEAATITSRTMEIVPSAAPSSLIVNASPRQVTFNWTAPPLRDRNGVITGYTVSCNSNATASIRQTFTGTGTNMMDGFRPNTPYRCAIFAVNSAGSGPPTYQSFTTTDDKLLFQLRLKSVSNCQEWTGDRSTEKVSDIMSEVLDAINGLCSCGLVADRLTESLLHCFPSSEQTVTFRAEIHGTIMMTASQLTMLMERWIGNDPSVNVLSVALNVDGTCDVVINSRSDGEQCALPSSSPSSTPIIAIAGGVIGGVILVTLFLIIIVVACIISYKKKKKYSLSKLNAEMNPYPSLPMRSIHPDNTSEDGTYEVIPPKLPPARNEDTTFSNPYSEIDGPRKKRTHERRPSDYEPVFVRSLGFVSTEESHPLSPKRSSISSQGSDPKLKLEDRDMPALNPAVGNDYEVVPNPGYKEKNQKSLEKQGQKDSSKEGKVLKNASYSEIPAIRSNTISTSHRQGLKGTSYRVTTKEDQGITGELPTTRSHSVSVSSIASNPMYASLGKDDKTKKGDVSSERNKDEAKIQLRDVGDLPITNGFSTDGQDNRQNMAAQEGAVHLTKNMSYAMYDVPANDDPRERVSRSKVNDTTSNSTTYDVPPNHPHEEITSSEVNGRSPNPNYNRYSVPPRQKMDSQTVNEGIANLNYSMYDVPPSNPRKINSSGGNEGGIANPNYAMYDVPPSNPREKNSLDGVGASFANPNYQMYDVPPSRPSGSQINGFIEDKEKVRTSSRDAAMATYDVPRGAGGKEVGAGHYDVPSKSPPPSDTPLPSK